MRRDVVTALAFIPLAVGGFAAAYAVGAARDDETAAPTRAPARAASGPAASAVVLTAPAPTLARLRALGLLPDLRTVAATTPTTQTAPTPPPAPATQPPATPPPPTVQPPPPPATQPPPGPVGTG